MMIFTWIHAAYRTVVDHLTKLLGVIGASIMALGAWVDPQSIASAASQYLGANVYRKIGVALFALVILRGWYTGRKARQS